MATSAQRFDTNAMPSRRQCRFFMAHGHCRYGDQCCFSHEQPKESTANICRSFLKGFCYRGDRCKYAHVQPQTSSHSQPLQSLRHLPSQSATIMSHDSKTYFNRSTNNSNQKWRVPYSSPAQTFCPNVNYDGECKLLKRGTACRYLHYEFCDLCHQAVLHPTNETQRREHRQLCTEKQEAKREEKLAIERSREKTCGVCLEIVWNKEGDPRFGLLENCDHIFCLQCIRTWRSLSNYEHQVVKACPECRTKSSFVTPAKYWPKNAEAKEKSIENYKQSLQKIHCKHFQRGEGRCPFGSKCFYLHVDKDGKPVQLAPPHRRPRRSRFGMHDSTDELSDLVLLSLISQTETDGFFHGWDFLFLDDDDDDDDDDENFVYQSYYTDDADSSENGDEYLSWT